MGSVVIMVAMLAHKAAAAAAAVFILLPAVFPLPLPAGDTPFLAIKIDRDQGGVKYRYDSAVSKQLQNLVVSGPPAEDIGFSGSATYQQPSVISLGHNILTSGQPVPAYW